MSKTALRFATVGVLFLVCGSVAAQPVDRRCERYGLQLVEGSVRGSTLNHSCSEWPITRDSFEPKVRQSEYPWIDPISREARSVAAGNYPGTVNGYWLVLEPVEGEEACLQVEDGERATEALVHEIFSRDDLEVRAIKEIGAFFLSTDTPDSGEGLISTIETYRRADIRGRAVYSSQDDNLWEIVSFEPSLATHRSLAAEGSSTSGLCVPGNGDDIADGRALIRSDPLKARLDKSRTEIRIGLFDSGVDSGRLSGTSFRATLDCRTGAGGGAGGNACVHGSGDSNEESHGTKSASILSGEGAGAYGGVTDLELVSFKIGIDTHQEEALKRALGSLGIPNRDQRAEVLLAQVQSIQTSRGVVAKLADLAFDSGHVVVAPVGNTGLGKGVTSPGNAHKVLGAGGVKIHDPTQLVGGYGPTRDGRTKPDVLGPTGTEALARGSGRCGHHIQTSGAAPYVAGAAALLKALVVNAFPPSQFPEIVDPGLIYPLTLVSGQTPYDACRTPKEGTGRILLPNTGRLFFGEVEIRQGESIWIPLAEVEKGSMVDAAIWWPETINQRHSDLDLQLLNPSFGPEGAAGNSFGSVFERVRATAQYYENPGGPWYLEISAQGVDDPCLAKKNDGKQRVYWAAYVAAGAAIKN